MLRLYAALAEKERHMISERIKAPADVDQRVARWLTDPAAAVGLNIRGVAMGPCLLSPRRRSALQKPAA
ncbi:hypothetical protein MES5069_510017 [Mesorhizobium escarrei]|uniref:Uncharacterized protein n=1 Tax=Mesorhizobium escarrei TaxID=666018 RepID=A0ABM9EA22_9HYPH|nr:hypothetical protein MES5069_510017 [Mesorhizobium escarrei]